MGFKNPEIKYEKLNEEYLIEHLNLL